MHTILYSSVQGLSDAGWFVDTPERKGYILEGVHNKDIKGICVRSLDSWILVRNTGSDEVSELSQRNDKTSLS